MTQALEELSEATQMAAKAASFDLQDSPTNRNHEGASKKEQVESPRSATKTALDNLIKETATADMEALEEDKRKAKVTVENLAKAVSYAEDVENRASQEIEPGKKRSGNRKATHICS